MVRTNPIPEELRGRPFSEQAETLPAREALRAVLAVAPGFRDETPDPVTFALGLLPLANAIFRSNKFKRVLLGIQARLPTRTGDPTPLKCLGRYD
jgi:hypothetical protein